MQDDVREIVLDYLRARDVAFVWREGFVDIPDAQAIPALASGRPSLRVTFDRESATLMPDVDYVTFGHPLLDTILEEVRSQHSYVERFYGTDLEKLRETGIPHLTWQPLEPGCPVPRVSKPRLRCEPLLVVRFQLDVESDFRHVETFEIVIDLDAGRLVPERATVARRPMQLPPAGFTPPASALSIPDALSLATKNATQACQRLIEFKHVEAQERLRAELDQARSAGVAPERLEHLGKELRRKYDVQARLRVIATERWFIERRLEFPVRVEGWTDPGAFAIQFDVEQDRTTIDLDGQSGTASARLHLRFCTAHHVDSETSALEPCHDCSRRFCRGHIDKCVDSGVVLCGSCAVECADCRRTLHAPVALTCELTAARLCRSDVGACELEACGKKVVRRSRLPVAKGKHYCDEHVFRCDAGELALLSTAGACSVTRARICPEHTIACSCGRSVSSEIVAPSARTQRPVCTACQVVCVECKRPFEKESTAVCALTGESACHADLVACAHAGCGKRVKKSRAIEFEGRRVCDEHQVTCPVEASHETLTDLLRSCCAEACGNGTCHRAEHVCVECTKSCCPTHRHAVVDDRSARFCPSCLAARPQCPTCGGPRATPATPCPLCVGVKAAPFRKDLTVPGPVLALAPSKVWRTGSEGAARIWECRVGLRMRRFVVIEGDPKVYEAERGFLPAVLSLFSGS